MPSYRAFDLCVSGDVRFPGLQRVEGPPDVEVRTNPVAEPSDFDDSCDGTRIRHGPAAVHLVHPRIGVVRVSDGRTIEVDPVRDTSSELLRQFLLSTAMRVLLHQRGNLVLHASAVEMDGEAVAFAGRSGAGKSTIAAACYANGHGVVADDVVAIRRDADGFRVLPAFPYLKIDRSAAELFGLPPVEGGDGIDSRYRYATRGFPEKPLPLAGVYLVERAADPGIERCEAGAGLHLLMRQTYSSYDSDETDAAASHFEECATIADQLPVQRLARPETFDRLSALVELIKRDQ